MALPTTEITGYIKLTDGANASDARLQFTLSGYDSDAVENTVLAPETITALLDTESNLSVRLWPNGRGMRGTQYHVTLIVPLTGGFKQTKYALGRITVPLSGPVDINDLLAVAPPDGVAPDIWYAQLSALVESAELAQEHAIAAQTAAAGSAEAASGAASVAVDAAATASGAASAAAGSALNAGTKASEAAAAALAASNSASGIFGLTVKIGNMSVTDNSIKSGFYHYDGTVSSGGPIGSGYGHVSHFRRAVGGGEAQIYIVESGGSLIPGSLYTRMRGVAAWGPWIAHGASIGVNANGYFAKYADGTMICTRHRTADMTVTLTPKTEGALAAFYVTDFWTFPAVFVEPPAYVTSFRSGTLGGEERMFNFTSVNNVTLSLAHARRVVLAADAVVLSKLSDTARGRWFAFA